MWLIVFVHPVDRVRTEHPGWDRVGDRGGYASRHRPIPVGGTLVGVAISPDGASAYIAGPGGAVSVIDTDANVVVDSIPVGSAPRDIAFTPSGAFAYVTDQNLNAVWRIDTGTRAVVGASIPVGNGATSIAITPDGAFAYVVNVCGDGPCAPIATSTVSIIDTSSNMLIGSVSVGYRAVGIAMAPDGEVAYVANQCGDDPNCASEGTVSVLDIAIATIVQTIPIGQPNSQGVAVAPDGSRAYVSNTTNDTVSVIDTTTNRVVGAAIAVCGAPSGLAVTPDGQFIFVANQDDASVSVIAADTNAVVATVPVGNHPSFLADTRGKR